MLYSNNCGKGHHIPEPVDVVLGVLWLDVAHGVGKRGGVVGQSGAVLDGEPLAGPHRVSRVDQVDGHVVVGDVAPPVGGGLGRVVEDTLAAARAWRRLGGSRVKVDAGRSGSALCSVKVGLFKKLAKLQHCYS